jgi:hypothetical protein
MCRSRSRVERDEEATLGLGFEVLEEEEEDVLIGAGCGFIGF